MQKVVRLDLTPDEMILLAAMLYVSTAAMSGAKDQGTLQVASYVLSRTEEATNLTEKALLLAESSNGFTPGQPMLFQ